MTVIAFRRRSGAPVPPRQQDSAQQLRAAVEKRK
jgi:hypothetical protein